MIIGVPKEIKNHEYRVGLTPESVEELVKDGHKVIIETSAGIGIGASDIAYKEAGASIAKNASEVFRDAKMIVKVKEPQALERKMLKQDQVLFTYLHLAPDRQQTIDLIESKAVCIAYETVTDRQGGLPLLRPMSQVAGRLAIQVGAAALQKNGGGRGVLLGGVPGVSPANVLIIGGGDVGFNAAQMAVGLQANVTILDRSNDVMKELNRHFGVTANVIRSTPAVLEEKLKTADLVVGAVLIPGAEAPKLITRKMLSLMMEGSVLVDVAIDQGGCFETSKATTHDAPTYTVDGVIHYCVANMPGAVARTSTYALNAATLSHVKDIARKGWKEALKNDPHLLNGLNVCQGNLTYAAVGKALGLDYIEPINFIN
ncbi:alanine dehydrogenase [Hellea sp.]|nr:alanine dehydrogenase [Hellea sp.]MDA8888186.1 alanine dehydrogenase [Hellea sp.]MDB4844032.1 alanine dehydrogenase [Hellea sp.]MDC0650899.1 alanine dehydrogenase [Hellea sp.]MDC1061815.1 alanine dehydrogenase [Hellea sp.]